MQISTTADPIIAHEEDIYNSVLHLDACNILDLGCGDGYFARAIAMDGTGRTVIAMEADEAQHRKNLEQGGPSNLTFKFGAAQNIPADDESFDIVLMFKSLHHVPLGLMGVAMGEVHRVLKPGGYAYISEPVYAGEFNELLAMFHDEERVRNAAFESVKNAVEGGDFKLLDQTYFDTYGHYSNFDEFEKYVINATYLDTQLAPDLLAKVKKKFESMCGDEGAHFTSPNRADILQKP